MRKRHWMAYLRAGKGALVLQRRARFQTVEQHAEHGDAGNRKGNHSRTQAADVAIGETAILMMLSLHPC